MAKKALKGTARIDKNISIVIIGMTDNVFEKMMEQVEMLDVPEMVQFIGAFIDSAVVISAQTEKGKPCKFLQFGFLDWNKKYPEIAWLIDFLSEQDERDWYLLRMGEELLNIEERGNTKEFPIKTDLYQLVMS